jgi:16S rRNA (cytidine1402-2'-O)-methyltransferase
MNSGILYIVATPIGNFEDITLRALETLKSVDYILAEDTRVTKNLLNHYQIKTSLISYHHHSQAKKIDQIIDLLNEGNNLALVTDAGTPGISDPGNILISEILKKTSSKITPIPGACAVISALSISGFPTDNFLFKGFPPHKNKRQKFFKEIAEQKPTIVFYESGHRIIKCLNELKNILPKNNQMVVCRELTKIHETIYRGTIEEIIESMKEERGEFTIVINQK